MPSLLGGERREKRADGSASLDGSDCCSDPRRGSSVRQELATDRLRQLRNLGYRQSFADLLDPAQFLTRTLQIIRDIAPEQQPGKIDTGEGLPWRGSHSPLLINRGT